MPRWEQPLLRMSSQSRSLQQDVKRGSLPFTLKKSPRSNLTDLNRVAQHDQFVETQAYPALEQ